MRETQSMPAEGPTPEQQADYLVRKMEQTIRDNRTVRGMSFATWQAIAREEIANAIRSAERRQQVHDRTVSRLALVASSALVTIGFWGAVAAVDRAYGGPAALAALGAGLALFIVGADWGIKRATSNWDRSAATSAWARSRIWTAASSAWSRSCRRSTTA
jgi:hypothetical protein